MSEIKNVTAKPLPLDQNVEKVSNKQSLQNTLDRIKVTSGAAMSVNRSVCRYPNRRLKML